MSDVVNKLTFPVPDAVGYMGNQLLSFESIARGYYFYGLHNMTPENNEEANKTVIDFLSSNYKLLYSSYQYVNKLKKDSEYIGEYLFETEGALIWTSVYATQLNMQITSNSVELSNSIFAKVSALAPSGIQTDNRVSVNIWFNSPRGYNNFARMLDVPSWSEIADNYPVLTRGKLLGLVNNFSSASGKLVLLHGEPGVGKTYLIRALMSKWRNNCSFNYITDPEVLFNNPGTLLNIISEQLQTRSIAHAIATEDLGCDSEAFWDPDAPTPQQVDQKMSVLILEDTGEIIASDAKEKSGQAMSRLLNLADGIIGQGLNLRIIITTNEDIGKIHPAIVRPGRCLASINFDKFTSTEAKQWLHDRNVTSGIIRGEGMVLADLYAMLDGNNQNREQTVKEHRQAGFVV